jgi:hypothetical protein
MFLLRRAKAPEPDLVVPTGAKTKECNSRAHNEIGAGEGRCYNSLKAPLEMFKPFELVEWCAWRSVCLSGEGSRQRFQDED